MVHLLSTSLVLLVVGSLSRCFARLIVLEFTVVMRLCILLLIGVLVRRELMVGVGDDLDAPFLVGFLLFIWFVIFMVVVSRVSVTVLTMVSCCSFLCSIVSRRYR